MRRLLSGCRWVPGAERAGVTLELDGDVAVLTIDRPEARNAIGSPRWPSLDRAIDGTRSADARGGGDRAAAIAFVAGGDLKELAAIRTHDDASPWPRPCARCSTGSPPSRCRCWRRSTAMPRRRRRGRDRLRHPHRGRRRADRLQPGDARDHAGVGRHRAAGPGDRPGPGDPGHRHRRPLRRPAAHALGLVDVVVPASRSRPSGGRSPGASPTPPPGPPGPSRRWSPQRRPSVPTSRPRPPTSSRLWTADGTGTGRRARTQAALVVKRELRSPNPALIPSHE